jgi:hypothetical protein
MKVRLETRQVMTRAELSSVRVIIPTQVGISFRMPPSLLRNAAQPLSRDPVFQRDYGALLVEADCFSHTLANRDLSG